MEGKADLALLGYLKASELGYEKAQANAAWILSQNQGIPAGQSATSYVQPGQLPFRFRIFDSMCSPACVQW